MHFADRIIDTCRAKDSRLVVGLDPHLDRFPRWFTAQYPADAVGQMIVDYFREVVDATLEVAVAYKPQIAFFEQLGPTGMQAFAAVLQHLRDKGALIITDAKRNDIHSTASAYARAFFGHGFPSDALTVNGYLGSDGIRPFLTDPANGIFVLVKTSNPSSGELQDMKLENGKSLAEEMADRVTAWNEATIGQSGYGNVGAVVGATYPDHMRHLRKRLPHSLILVPGYGAQGGDKAAISAAFASDGLGALINSARAILFPRDLEEGRFAAITEAARAAHREIRALSAG